MPWQKPSPESTIDAIERRLAEVERALRRGKAAPNVRHLGDTDTDRTAKATDGQALVYNKASGMWRPGSAGSLPTLFVSMSTTSVPTGAGTTLSWSAPDNNITHNVGGGFTFSGGTTITVVSRCLLDVLCAVRFATENGDQRILTLSGPEWAPTEFMQPTIAAAGDSTRVVVATGAYCTAGDTFSIGAIHDATSAVPVSDGFLMVSRRALI